MILISSRKNFDESFIAIKFHGQCLSYDHDASKFVKNSNQFDFKFNMRLIVLVLIFHLVFASPIIRNDRTIELPSIMEIMARKLGFIDFMTKFVRGVKATFFGALFNKKEK